MPTLPLTTITLEKISQNDDSSSMSIVTNKNIQVIQDALNSLQSQITEFDPTTSITQDQFNMLLANSKNYVIIRANMVNGESIDFNGYRITRVGTPSGGASSSIEFRVIDTNTERNTDFRKTFVHMRDYAGYSVYPSILVDSTFVSIIFADIADVSPTNVNPAVDANNKRLIIL